MGKCKGIVVDLYIVIVNSSILPNNITQLIFYILPPFVKCVTVYCILSFSSSFFQKFFTAEILPSLYTLYTMKEADILYISYVIPPNAIRIVLQMLQGLGFHFIGAFPHTHKLEL